MKFRGSETEVKERAAGVKLLILDVDGVLTNGSLIWQANGQESKVFHVHDGHGIRLLQRAGVEVALLTGRSSRAVTERANDLGIELVAQKSRDKLADYQKMLKKRNLDDRNVGYVGDDLVDVPVLRRVGLAVTVADAAPQVHTYCHATTRNKGGDGAVREVCEFLLQAQGKWEEVTSPYLGETAR